MQLDFLWPKREELPPPSVLQLDSTRQIPIVFQRNDRARRYLLRLRPDGTACVTIPRRGSMRQARAFVDEHKGWLLRQLVKLQARPKTPQEWEAGTEIFFRGEIVKLEFNEEARSLTLAQERILFRPGHSLRKQVESHLLKIAQRELPGRVQAFAQQHDCRIHQITVRNQRSRWGSCSVRGTISLNWRLIQMPPAVCDYIILHELMHTKEMNHSRRFWARVAEVCPDFAAQERWLKTHGSRLGLR